MQYILTTVPTGIGLPCRAKFRGTTSDTTRRFVLGGREELLEHLPYFIVGYTILLHPRATASTLRLLAGVLLGHLCWRPLLHYSCFLSLLRHCVGAVLFHFYCLHLFAALPPSVPRVCRPLGVAVASVDVLCTSSDCRHSCWFSCALRHRVNLFFRSN